MQHCETLQQYWYLKEEYDEMLEWFITLPLYYEDDLYNAVHACWDNENIKLLRNTLEKDRLTNELLHETVKKGTKLNGAID